MPRTKVHRWPASRKNLSQPHQRAGRVSAEDELPPSGEGCSDRSRFSNGRHAVLSCVRQVTTGTRHRRAVTRTGLSTGARRGRRCRNGTHQAPVGLPSPLLGRTAGDNFPVAALARARGSRVLANAATVRKVLPFALAEDAGAGKSVFTRRALAFGCSQRGREALFASKSCLAVRWEQWEND